LAFYASKEEVIVKRKHYASPFILRLKYLVITESPRRWNGVIIIDRIRFHLFFGMPI
jgi:hypothetical protein